MRWRRNKEGEVRWRRNRGEGKEEIVGKKEMRWRKEKVRWRRKYGELCWWRKEKVR